MLNIYLLTFDKKFLAVLTNKNKLLVVVPHHVSADNKGTMP